MRTCIMIKDHVIRYVHATKPALTSIQSYGERFLPAGVVREGQIMDRETFTLILEECIDKWKINRHHVQYCVPDSFVLIRNVLVPADVVNDEIQGYLYMELGESFHLPFEDPIFDYKVIGQKDGQKEILLVASREKIVMELFEVFKELKLHPNVADISPLSYYRLLTELRMVNEEEHLLLVQYDVTSMNLTVFTEHRPSFSRHFIPSIDQEKWKVVEEGNSAFLQWDGEVGEIDEQAQSLITEIERVMNFYRFSVMKGKGGITRMVLVGDHPELERIANTCKQSLEITVDDLFRKEQGSEIDSVHYSYHDALGLLLKKEVRS